MFSHRKFLNCCHRINGDILVKGKGNPLLSRRDGVGLVVIFNTLKIATLFESFCYCEDTRSINLSNNTVSDVFLIHCEDEMSDKITRFTEKVGQVYELQLQPS
jgi:hypothetical protein